MCQANLSTNVDFLLDVYILHLSLHTRIFQIISLKFTFLSCSRFYIFVFLFLLFQNLSNFPQFYIILCFQNSQIFKILKLPKFLDFQNSQIFKILRFCSEFAQEWFDMCFFSVHNAIYIVTRNPLPSAATARPLAVSSLRSPNPVYMTAEDP